MPAIIRPSLGGNPGNVSRYILLSPPTKTNYYELKDAYNFDGLSVGYYNADNNTMTKLKSSDIRLYPNNNDYPTMGDILKVYHKEKMITTVPLDIVRLDEIRLVYPNTEYEEFGSRGDIRFPVNFSNTLANVPIKGRYRDGSIREFGTVSQFVTRKENEYRSGDAVRFTVNINGRDFVIDITKNVVTPISTFGNGTWKEIMDTITYARSNNKPLTEFFTVGDKRSVKIRIGNSLIDSEMVILHINPSDRMCKILNNVDVYGGSTRPSLIIGFTTPTNYWNGVASLRDYTTVASNIYPYCVDEYPLLQNGGSRVIDTHDDINKLIKYIKPVKYIPLVKNANRVKSNGSPVEKSPDWFAEVESSLLCGTLSVLNYMPFDPEDDGSKVFDYYKTPMNRIKNHINHTGKVIQYLHNIEVFFGANTGSFSCVDVDGRIISVPGIFNYTTRDVSDNTIMDNLGTANLDTTTFQELVFSEYFAI
jgi:hypothetical protein